MKMEERIGGRGSGKMMPLEEWLRMFPAEAVKNAKFTIIPEGVNIEIKEERK